MSEERPYVEADLPTSKAALIKLVQRQQSKWPEAKFHVSRVTIAQLRSALLNRNNGFTTNEPLPLSPHPPKSTGRKEGSAETPRPIPTTSHEEIDPPPSLIASHGDIELHDVRIYVEDFRSLPSQKTVALVSLPVLDRFPGGFRVHSKEILAKIQASNGAIHIPSTGSHISRLSVPDPEDPDWKVPFVRISSGQLLEEMTFNPEALDIPETCKLKIFVDNLTVAEGIKADEGSPSLAASTSLLVSLTPAGPADAAGTDPEEVSPAIKFLREQLALRPGYQAFLANRGRILANPEIVKIWRFAVEFSNDYNKMRQPVKITKSSIQEALGFGSTWLTNAQNAIQIMNEYRQVPEVTEVLERIDESPAGSTALYNFLVDWKMNHPLASRLN
ncbi:hypothetical protein B0H11DRAFT_2238707 [Mycena galericulata]|nr:hypothetical protein B0H11DRAFT_2238707 [Mycena galericulata]